MNLRVILFCLLLVVPTICFALDYEADGVIKWCRADGNVVTYTTENIVPAGYVKCGELSKIKYCDPVGNRFFGPENASPPYAYLDCARGPRIYIKRLSPPVNDSFDVSSSDLDSSAAKEKPKMAATSRQVKSYDDYLASLDDVLDIGEGATNKHKTKTKKVPSIPSLPGGIDVSALIKILQTAGEEL